MTGQQHRSAALGHLLDTLLKCLLHQRVQTRGWFVENVELGVGGERGDDRHLLPIALGVGAGLLVGVEFEALDQLVAPAGVDAVAAQPGQKVDGLQAGQVGPQRHIARDVGDSAVQLNGVVPRVAAEQPHGSAVGPQQAEQHADRRGLTRSVRSEESGDISRRDHQVEAVECLGSARMISTIPGSRPPIAIARQR